MWGVVLVSPEPLITPMNYNSSILRQSKYHFKYPLSLYLPPLPAALRLLHARRCHQLRTASPINKFVTSDKHSSQFSNPFPKTPNPLPIQTNSEPERLEGVEVQLSGSDVLWALKNAIVRKKQKQQMEKMKMKKMKMKTNVPSDKSTDNDNPTMDYSKVKPLCIKSDWGDRLDELDKRLKELPQTI